MSRNINDFFVTISKNNRGSLFPEEIQQIVDYFKAGITDGSSLAKYTWDKLFIVNEHCNKSGQLFEHLHIYIHSVVSSRTDKLREQIEKQFPEIIRNRKQDLDVRQATNVEELLAGYMMKTSDYNILYNHNITDEYIEKAKQELEVKKDFKNKIYGENKVIRKNRIGDSDIPFFMFEYIHTNLIDYDFKLVTFKYLIKRLLRENYDFKLSKLVEVKAKLDVLFCDENKEGLIDALIDDQFRMLHSVYACEDGNSFTNLKDLE